MWGYSAYDATKDGAVRFLKMDVGKVVSFMTGRETLDTAVYLIERMTKAQEVMMTSYCMDDPALVNALKGALQRGAKVTIVGDRTQTLSGGSSRLQPSITRELWDIGNGAPKKTRKFRLCLTTGCPLGEVYASAGRRCVGGRGIMHSKMLWLKPNFIVGSTNWTLRARCNVETSVLCQMTGEAAAQIVQWFERAIFASEEVVDVETVGKQALTWAAIKSRLDNRGRSASRKDARSRAEDPEGELLD